MVALTLISGVQYFVKARDNLQLPGSNRMSRPTAAVLLTGSELLDGRTRDRNGHYLGATLSRAGFRVTARRARPRRPRRPAAATSPSCSARRPTLLVTSGGLGTTHDDLTAATVGRVTGRALASDPEALRMVTETTRRVAERRGLALDELLPAMARRRCCRAAAGRSLPPGWRRASR